MAYNFPSNPTLDQTYTFNDFTWKWNGRYWQILTNTAFIGATGATGIGATGATGVTGIPGTPGTPGAAGADGSTGATGTPGTPGAAGADGSTGATGPQGPAGAPGTNLASATEAFTRIFTGTGSQTDFYLQANIAHSSQLVTFVDGIYQVPDTNFTSNTSWIKFVGAPEANAEIIVQSVANTFGATGPQGSTGLTGSPGGATGATGPSGATGEIGATGVAGTPGTPGTSANVIVSDEGTVLTTAVTGLNFVGSAVTASAVDGNVTITISGTGGTGYTLTYSNIAPASPVVGDRWINSDDLIELVYIDDGDNTFWIEPAGGTGGGGGSSRFTYSNTAPAGAQIGDRWIDSDTLREFVRIYDGDEEIWIEPFATPGSNGATGATGAGATGATGIAGNIGATGATGVGATGATGPAGTSANVNVNPTAPVSPDTGTLWFNNESGDLYVYAGGGWVLIGGGGGGSGGVAQVYDVESASTGYFDLPSGTTAQRPGTPTTGQIRYNSTTGFAEVYTTAGWGAFGAQPPAISSVTPATYNGEANTEFTINGANFTVDASVKFVDNAGTEYIASSVTFIDSTTLRVRTPQDFTVAQEPLDVKVLQASGQITRVDCIDCGGVPAWTTAAGSLGTQNMNTAVSIQLVVTDPDAGATITYSLTSGSLPSGVTLNSSTGLISGTAPTVFGDTTYNFTITAADNAGNQSARAFSFTVTAIDPHWAQVVMLLRGDGANGSTTIVDSSTTGRTFTIVGSTAIDTSIKKFGTGSIAILGGGNTASFYQSGGNLTIPGAFTMEAWVYLLGSGRHALLGQPSGQAYSTAWGFAILDTIGPYSQTGAVKGISWILSPINGYGGNIVWSGQYPTLNTWTHIAVCRNASGNWSFYMDGIKGTTQNSNSQANGTYSGFPTDDGPTGSMTIPVYTGNFNGLTSGGNSVGMPAGFNGYLDEFRITIGTARYSADFTPPGGPFPNQ